MVDLPTVDKLPTGGGVQVERVENDMVIAFLGKDGEFHWFKFDDDDAALTIAQALVDVASGEKDIAP